MRAKLFLNGRSQAVRLPACCRFEGTEVDVEHDPNTGTVVLTPVRSSPLNWLRERAEVLDQDPENPSFAEFFEDLRSDEPAQPRGWP